MRENDSKGLWITKEQLKNVCGVAALRAHNKCAPYMEAPNKNVWGEIADDVDDFCNRYYEKFMESDSVLAEPAREGKVSEDTE